MRTSSLVESPVPSSQPSLPSVAAGSGALSEDGRLFRASAPLGGSGAVAADGAGVVRSALSECPAGCSRSRTRGSGQPHSSEMPRLKSDVGSSASRPVDSRSLAAGWADESVCGFEVEGSHCAVLAASELPRAVSHMAQLVSWLDSPSCRKVHAAQLQQAAVHAEFGILLTSKLRRGTTTRAGTTREAWQRHDPSPRA